MEDDFRNKLVNLLHCSVCPFPSYSSECNTYLLLCSKLQFSNLKDYYNIFMYMRDFDQNSSTNKSTVVCLIIDKNGYITTGNIDNLL